MFVPQGWMGSTTGWRGFRAVVITLAAAALSGCSERPAITEPGADPASGAVTIAAKPAGPSIVGIDAGSGSFVIDGDPVPVEVTVTNPGRSISNALIAVRVDQASSGQEVASVPVSCPGGAPGVLVSGATCTMQVAVAVAAGSGATAVTAGPATLEVSLVQASGKKGKVLDATSLAIELAGGSPPPPASPSISSVVLSGSTLELEGAGLGYAIAIANPGGALSGLIVQGRLVQGSTDRAAGGTHLLCPGAALGELPAGGCTFDWEALATNLAGGAGILVVGGATLVLDLYHAETLLDTWEEEVSITADNPYIGAVALGSGTLNLGGGPTSLSVSMINPMGYPFDPVQVLATIRQGESVHRYAGDDDAQCDGYPRRTLPPGECTIVFSIVASNATAGDGDLDEGPAVLELVLRNTIQNILDVKQVPILLVRE